MFCSKCGNQLKNEDKFCGGCGERCGESFERSAEPNMVQADKSAELQRQGESETDAGKILNAQTEKSTELQQQGEPEASTGKIFMEQLGALSKTGAKGIKEAAAKAQIKAGELSQSVEQSQNLGQLGDKKNLFMLVCGALALNIILLLSKTIYFGMNYFGEGTFSVIGFCSEMTNFINEYARYAEGATDAPFYTTVKFLEIIGIIFIVGAVIKTAMPLFTSSEGTPVSFKLIKISAIFSIALTFLFMFFVSTALSSQNGMELHLTGLGWLYVIESVALIIAVFKLSPNVRKNNVMPS